MLIRQPNDKQWAGAGEDGGKEEDSAQLFFFFVRFAVHFEHVS